MSIFLARKLMVTILSLSLFVPPLVSAAEDEYVCDAKQSSKNELPVLSQSCPIGKGIWGGKPSAETGMFWIQCGLLNAPLSLKEAQPIYRSISTDVWIKPESKGYRCLIGPYETFSNASSDLVKVRKLKPYKEAFIRDASGGNSEPAVMKTKPAPKPKAKPVAKPKPKATPKPVVPPVAATEKPAFLLLNRLLKLLQQRRLIPLLPVVTSRLQRSISLFLFLWKGMSSFIWSTELRGTG